MPGTPHRTSGYHSQENCEDAIQDLDGQIAETTFDDFMNAHFSPVDEEPWSKVMETLEPQTALPSGLEDGTLPGLETDFYRPLVLYFDSVLKAYCSVSPHSAPDPLIQFYSDPHFSINSTDSSACIGPLWRTTRAVLGSAEGGNSCDVVYKSEYKKDNTAQDVDDNVLNIISNSAQVLYSGSLSKFHFWLHIERTDFRIWSFSRSNVLVTEIKDLNKDRRDLVSFIIALGSANLEELGFDTTVSRKTVDGVVQYVYRINDKKYETVRPLSTYKAATLVTRGTRVWVVRLIGDESRIEYVLKDSWIIEDNTDFQIHQSIRAALKIAAPSSLEDFRKHFVEILEGVIVPTSPISSREYSMESEPFLLQRLSSSYIKTSRTTTESRHSLPVGQIPLCGVPSVIPTREIRLNKKRRHCRVLYAGVGESLDELNLKDYKAASNCVCQAIEGLNLLYLVEWMHRDISIGNLVAFKQKNGEYICKIIDLEFAKKYEHSPSGHPEPKIGTPYFMACETATQAYLHIEDNLDCLDPTPPVFCHNFLHDVESLWWILVYLLFSTYPAGHVIDKQSDWVDTFKKIFSPFSDLPNDRERFVRGATLRTPYISKLPERFHDEARALSGIIMKINNHYKRLEALPAFPDSYEAFSGIYDLAESFKEATSLAYSGPTKAIAI